MLPATYVRLFCLLPALLCMFFSGCTHHPYQPMTRDSPPGYYESETDNGWQIGYQQYRRIEQDELCGLAKRRVEEWRAGNPGQALDVSSPIYDKRNSAPWQYGDYVISSPIKMGEIFVLDHTPGHINAPLVHDCHYLVTPAL